MAMYFLNDMAGAKGSQNPVACRTCQHRPIASSCHSKKFSSDDVRIHDDRKDDRNSAWQECALFVCKRKWIGGVVPVPLVECDATETSKRLVSSNLEGSDSNLLRM
jgi:hypothetical protein